MAEHFDSQGGVINLHEPASDLDRPADLEDASIASLNYEPIGVMGAVVSALVFAGSGFVLFSILFSPEIALVLALHWAAKH